MMKTIITITLSALAALVSVRWIYFKILAIAKDKNLVDNPDARKLQKMPVPVMGGVAVFFGLVVGLLMGIMLQKCFGLAPVTQLMPVVCAMVVMLYAGAIDDAIGLSPWTRIVIEVLSVAVLIVVSGSCIDTFHGMWGIYGFSWWVAVPLTLLAGVGIINAVNMIDGVNGLSSGFCITSSILFGIAFVWVGDVQNAVLAFSMTGALLPFFVHNVFGRHSRMFVGDAGTMVMGIMITWFVICMLDGGSPFIFYAKAKHINMIAFSMAALSVPIFDTLRVMVMRIFRGDSPFHPDKTHLHHMFLKVGFSHFFTMLIEILLDLLVVGIWALSVLPWSSLEFQLYLVISVGVIVVWGSYALLEHQYRKGSGWLLKVAERTLHFQVGSRSRWKHLAERLDAPEKTIER